MSETVAAPGAGLPDPATADGGAVKEAQAGASAEAETQPGPDRSASAALRQEQFRWGAVLLVSLLLGITLGYCFPAFNPTGPKDATAKPDKTPGAVAPTTPAAATAPAAATPPAVPAAAATGAGAAAKPAPEPEKPAEGARAPGKEHKPGRHDKEQPKQPKLEKKK